MIRMVISFPILKSLQPHYSGIVLSNPLLILLLQVGWIQQESELLNIKIPTNAALDMGDHIRDVARPVRLTVSVFPSFGERSSVFSPQKSCTDEHGPDQYWRLGCVAFS
jgi:hypothetical protein